MAVVTRHSAGALLKGAIVLDLGDLQRQGQRVIAAAEIKAQSILGQAVQQAEVEAAAIRERALAEARAQGAAEGLEEGRRRGHDEAVSALRERLGQVERKWTDLANEWQQTREGLEREGRTAVLELGLALGEKLLHRTIEVDPTVVADQLRAALSHVLRPTDVAVLIHPEDRPMLEEAMPALAVAFGHLRSIALKDDSGVERGGCVLQFGQGSIDATLQTQLRRVAELLLPDKSAPWAPAGTGPAASATDADKETDSGSTEAAGDETAKKRP